jgi:hypothetical protein
VEVRGYAIDVEGVTAVSDQIEETSEQNRAPWIEAHLDSARGTAKVGSQFAIPVLCIFKPVLDLLQVQQWTVDRPKVDLRAE